MTQRKHTPSYMAEFCTGGVRVFKENRANYASDNAACRAIAPTTYYARAAVMRDPELASDRAKSDVVDCEDIERIGNPP